LRFLKTHSRSNKKLIALHGSIAVDIQSKLGKEYEVRSLGIGNGREAKLDGRYMAKKVDILISKGNDDIAGVGIKFVMNNYSQNTNNYFENMLGETANIRTNNKEYFQILILSDEMPYYDNKGKITKWEKVTERNIHKYIALSHDNIDRYLHTPIKTLLFIIKFPECDQSAVTTKSEYKQHFLSKENNTSVLVSDRIAGSFGKTIIFNDYSAFIQKIVYYIKSM